MSGSHQRSQYRRHGHGRNTTQGSFAAPGASYSYTPQRSFTVDPSLTRLPDYRATSSSDQFPAFDAKADNAVPEGSYKPPNRRMATLPATFGYQGVLQQEVLQHDPSYQYPSVSSSTSQDVPVNYIPTITTENTGFRRNPTTLTLNEIVNKHGQQFICQPNCYCDIRVLLFALGIRDTFYNFHDLKMKIGRLLSSIDIESGSYFKDVMQSLKSGDARLIQDLLDETSKMPFFKQTCQNWISKLVRYSDEVPSSVFIESNTIMLLERDPYFGGGFSDVYRCRHSGRLLAAKAPRIFGEGDDVKFLEEMGVWLREAIIWHQADHPRILKFMGISKTLILRRWCFLSPWMENGNILNYLARRDVIPDLELSLRLSTQAAEGLDYLHSRGWIHGDVKSSNILIDDWVNVKLSDLGLSSHHQTSQLRTGGDARYMAPEIWRGAGSSFQADVYSFGMAIFEIVSGIEPFRGIRRERMGEMVKNGDRPERPASRYKERLYDDVWSLINDCWSPGLRPNMAQVLQRLTSMPLRIREWSQFSFYSSYTVTYGGLTYCSAYSLFQALRFPNVATYIQQLWDNARVRNYVNQLGNRPYDEQDLSNMEFCLHLKFQQHENLRTALIASENRYIYYISPTDTFWGFSGDSRQGQNRLGICLMGVRETLSSTIVTA